MIIEFKAKVRDSGNGVYWLSRLFSVKFYTKSALLNIFVHFIEMCSWHLASGQYVCKKNSL